MPDHTEEVNPRITKTINISANVREPEIDPNDYAKLYDPNQTIVAKEFIGDGSKLTNLPGGGGGDVNLDEYAKLIDTEQDIVARSFDAHINDGDPLLEDEGKVSATTIITGLGAKFGGGFRTQGGNGPLIITSNTVNMEGIYVYSQHERDDTSRVASLTEIGLEISNSNEDNSERQALEFKNDGLIVDGTDITVTDGYFIGDGSKLTGLPTPEMSEYARLDAENTFTTSNTFNEGVLFKDSGSGIANSYLTGGSFNVKDSNISGVFLSYDPVIQLKTGGMSAGKWTDEYMQVGSNAEYSRIYKNKIVLATSAGAHTNHVEIDGSGSITAKEFIGDGSKLTNLPTSVLEGAMVFKGTVENEAALPTEDNAVGEMWHTTEEDALFAWGEDNDWHNVGSAGADVNLDEYAKLDGVKIDGITKTIFTATQLLGENIGARFFSTEVEIPESNNDHNYRMMTSSHGITLYNSPAIDRREMPYNGQRNTKAFELYDDFSSPKLGPWQMTSGQLGFCVQQDGTVQSTGNKSTLHWNDAYTEKIKTWYGNEDWEFDPNALENGMLPYQMLQWVSDTPTGETLNTSVYWNLYGDLYIGKNLTGDREYDSEPLVEENANIKILREGTIEAKEFIGDGSKLTGVGGDSTVKFIDCQEPAPPESEWKVGDIYIYKSTEPYELWSETCQGKCHAEWVECMESTGEEHACYNKYVPCLMGCDEDLTREQAEAIAKKGKQQPKGVVDMAHESWTGIAGELLDDGEYIICTDLYCGNKVDLYWQRMPKGASWSDVDKCAKKTDYTQTIIAKEFVGDGSKLTGVGLPDLRTLTPLT